MSAEGATFVVNSNADTNDGVCDAHCTLREAINLANGNPGADSITFNIAPAGLQTITTSGLPAIGDAVTIDATTQPGGGTTPRVQITESASLSIGANNVTVRGFVINGPAGTMIVTTGTDVVIAGNFIGTDSSGLASGGGGSIGILGSSGNVTVGGEGAGDGNVIAGLTFGIGCFPGPGTCTVKQNIIGLGADGTTVIGNQYGILFTGEASGQIGGSTAAARNIISGNSSYGIGPAEAIFSMPPASVTVAGNYIGTDISGTVARPNGVGVALDFRFDVTLSGNLISGNNGDAVQGNFANATFNNGVFIGNRIGTDATGAVALPNGGHGISVTGANVTIGGAAAGERNVISGNGGDGVIVSANTAVVKGNYIGTNAAGTVAIPNLGEGMSISAGSITIGGALAGEGNLVSGNTGAAIVISNGIATVAGNRIGTDVTGTAAIPNGSGIQITGGADHTIGGLTAEAGNVISGNSGRGLDIGVNAVVAYNNAIGTDASGSSALPNGGEGIAIAGSGNAIGSTAPDTANTIAFNGGAGVLVSSGTGNGIEGNSIFSNSGLGIDLAPGGVTPNDAADLDAGVNNLQNFPTLTRAVRVPSGTTTVTGVLSSTISATFTVDFYASSAADPTGYGEGQRFLGSITVITDAAGNAPFTFTTPGAAAGDFITATATSATSDTSEFSQAVIVTTPGTLQFSASAYSVSESGPTVTMTVTRSGGSAGTVTVDYATSNATATAAADYAATNGTLSFAEGETSKTFTVAIVDDAINEANETFTITLSNPTGGAVTSLTPATTVTIVDNDPLPALSINDVSLTEGSSAAAPATFTVTLTPASGRTVTVNYSTVDQTANAGSDYIAASGTLTFNPGETTKTIAVLVNGDTIAEPDETFAVNLLTPANAVVGQSPGIGTIVNDDLPQIAINDVVVVEGDSGTTNAVLTLSLSAASASAVTVNWATADDTATAGSDYTASSGTVTFNPGVTAQTISVPVLGDTTVDLNETFFINLSAPANATIADPQGSVTIADDDGSPVISINDVTMPERNSGTTNFVFTVVLAPASATAVTVNYATAVGTATAGSDFTAVSGTITFNPGETTKSITVPVKGDRTVEANETFFVKLSAPAGATISRGQGTGTIVNDDAPPPTPVLPSVFINDASTIEGNAGAHDVIVTVTLSPAGANASVRYATADQTATAGSDYQSVTGTLLFGPGETTKTISIPILGDVTDESDETFLVRLSNPSGLVLARAEAAVTIVDDDAPAANRVILAIVGSANGAAASRFRTSLQLLNATAGTMTGSLVFHPMNADDASADVSSSYTLAPGEMRYFADLVQDMGANGLGTVDLWTTAGDLPVATARIYNDGGAAGTSGFVLPALLVSDALPAGARAVITAPPDPIGSRFNIGVRTLDEGATLTISVRSTTGDVLKTLDRSYGANFLTQIAAADFATMPLSANEYISIEVAAGRAIVYGSWIDNITNDPSVQLARRY